MIRRAPRLLVSVALAVLAFTPAARAATFDFIYTDVVNVTLCPNGCGITLAGTDFGLVVNKGLADLTPAELFATTFTATSSNPAMSLTPFINNPGPPIPPLHTNVAVGGVTSSNNVLTTKMLPGESLINTAGEQLIAFEIQRTGFNNFAGPVTFDVTMTMGDHFAHFFILANVTLGGPGEFAISFPSAARISSVPLATAARSTTWGAIKTLYR